MGRKLASIQRIKLVEPIKDADNIERITVLGWHCVAKKGEFIEGDLCIYCEVDSLLPEDNLEFEFLKPRGMRIRTIKLRGQISQGICFPLNILRNRVVNEGDDVTEILQIIKWEPKLPVHLFGLAKSILPSFIPKTDETRIQSIPDLLDRHKGIKVYSTEKVDGTSLSVWNSEEFGVGSRKLSLKETEDSVYWMTIKKLDIPSKLDSNISLQGELVGDGIQKNKYGFKSREYDVFWFNAYDIKQTRYLSFKDFNYLIKFLNLKTVPVVNSNFELNQSVDELVEMSIGKSLINSSIQREGIVIRSIVETNDIKEGRVSFKVVNPHFLLKYDE